MKVHLSPVENEPRVISEELEVPVQRLDPEVVAEAVKVRLDLVIRSHQDTFNVAGEMALSGSLLCCRCLEPVPWQARESFQLTVAGERPGESDENEEEVELAEEDLEVMYLAGDELDLEQLAAEQTLLALPMRVVCRDNCAGICPTCGGNRNIEGACHCEPQRDPRWEALRDLRGAGS